jgi:hypothetical protein
MRKEHHPVVVDVETVHIGETPINEIGDKNVEAGVDVHRLLRNDGPKL